MTLLVSWAGFDSHGCTSAYIASDSRISFSVGKHTYDYGKKVFCSKKYPEIFGFVGDALFPSFMLQQIIEMIDNNLIINEKMSCKEKNDVIFKKISDGLHKYKDIFSNNSIEIIHVTRRTIEKANNGKKVYPKFYIYTLSYNGKTNKWDTIKKEFSDKERYIIFGSGKNDFCKRFEEYKIKPNGNTTRAIFQCFCDSLENADDKCVGGYPQLVGIKRKPKDPGKQYGIIYKKKRYFSGIEVPMASNYNSVEWRNENFEIADGKTKKKKPNAKKQPNLVKSK